MAIRLRDVYRETKKKYRLTLISGESGLGNLLKWVYVTEDHNTTDFLQGGELIITTGVLSQGDPDWLLLFLERVRAKGSCGVILNVGCYLWEKDITREVRDFCDREAFPLFIMPWHIHMYDITRDYYNRIFQDSRRSEELSWSVQALATGGPDREKALALLEKNNFPAKDRYYLATLCFDNAPDSVLLDNEPLLYRVLAELNSYSCYLVTSGSCLLLCHTGERSEAADMVSQLHCCLRNANIPCRIGVSGCLDNLDALPEGLSQAQAATALHPGQEVSFYGDLGFFQILAAVQDQATLEAFAAQQLAAVHAYDEEHHSDFARTLRLYLELEHSVQAVAESSFCHRNTVSHRLRILREMGYQLEQPKECFSLLAAFWTEDYLRLRNKEPGCCYNGTHSSVKKL